MMDLDEYHSAARQIAEYAKRSAKKRGKKYRSSGWKYYLGDYRGAKYGRLLEETGYAYCDTQAWANLKKCWKGLIIAKSQGNEEKMRYYAKGIMKFQKQLGLEVRVFPDLGLWEIEDTNDYPREMKNEIESGNNENQDESYEYESEAQQIWRERMEQPYESPAQKAWREKMEKYY
jgi:hypothetical protein